MREDQPVTEEPDDSVLLPTTPPLIAVASQRISDSARHCILEAFRNAASTGTPVIIDPSLHVYQKIDGVWAELGCRECESAKSEIADLSAKLQEVTMRLADLLLSQTEEEVEPKRRAL